MLQSFDSVLRMAQESKVDLRTGAMIGAVKRVADALMTRRIYP